MLSVLTQVLVGIGLTASEPQLDSDGRPKRR